MRTREITDASDNHEIEQLLGGYRPAGPPDSLRARVLETAATPRRLRAWTTGLSTAAVFLLAVAVHLLAKASLLALIAALPVEGY